MLDCIDWNQSGTTDTRDQTINMVTEWERKNCREDEKVLQVGWQGTLFIEDRGYS